MESVVRLPVRSLGVAELLFATTAWGSLFIVSKPVLAHVHPVWYTLLRYTIAALAFAALLVNRGARPWRLLREHAARLALLGGVGYGAFSVLVLVGLAHSVPSHGAVVMATMPITTQMVRWAVEGIRPTRTVLASTALSLLGVLMVSGALWSDAGSNPSTLVGDLTALTGTLGWITYTRGASQFAKLDVLEYSALTALAAWPLLVVVAIVGATIGWAPVPRADQLALTWEAIGYTGLVPTVLSVLAYNAGVRSLGVVTGTAFLNFVPVSTVVIGAAQGRVPAGHEIAGVALVIVALLMQSLSQRSATAPRRPDPVAGRVAVDGVRC